MGIIAFEHIFHSYMIQQKNELEMVCIIKVKFLCWFDIKISFKTQHYSSKAHLRWIISHKSIGGMISIWKDRGKLILRNNIHLPGGSNFQSKGIWRCQVWDRFHLWNFVIVWVVTGGFQIITHKVLVSINTNLYSTCNVDHCKFDWYIF